ncbi:hypothetical protein BU16DRAFT_533769 [Lophium mytilinum]|uniref:Uncharacterized protein n=1 Tax=Lophium mytilinum TaxID=390894 RepID=A0A6A6R983_9PEZI|nr:hypothetical protein BU16DRAFT_533769 [Lophium mytilinum]
MISIPSKYIYKKYQKHKQEKEDALAAGSAHHDEMVNEYRTHDPAYISGPPKHADMSHPNQQHPQPPPYPADEQHPPWTAENRQNVPYPLFHQPPAHTSPSSAWPQTPPPPASPQRIQKAQSPQAGLPKRGQWVWQPAAPEAIVPSATIAASLHESPSTYREEEHHYKKFESERLPVELPANSESTAEDEGKKGMAPTELPAGWPTQGGSSTSPRPPHQYNTSAKPQNPYRS